MIDIVASASDLIRTNPDLANEVARQLGQKPTGGLTIRQGEVLNFIRAYHAERGFAPSFAEIAEGVGLGSKSGVSRIVDGLVERGYIGRMAHQARSIVVLGVQP